MKRSIVLSVIKTNRIEKRPPIRDVKMTENLLLNKDLLKKANEEEKHNLSKYADIIVEITEFGICLKIV
ncbi:MAG: hypothetical protein ACFFB8_15645 [Promethearchaeota archaeon]